MQHCANICYSWNVNFPYAYLHVYKENGLLFLVQDAFYKNVEWLYKQEFWFNITSYIVNVWYVS